MLYKLTVIDKVYTDVNGNKAWRAHSSIWPHTLVRKEFFLKMKLEGIKVEVKRCCCCKKTTAGCLY